MTYQRRLLLLSLLLALVAAGAFLWYEGHRQEDPVVYATTTPVIADPTRLIIPKIGVDANIQHVGIAKSGNMAVPNNYTDVGWFRLGALPGEEGNAVIAGHLDTGFGTPAVFSRLETLSAGDEIYVADATGTQARFIVLRFESYDSRQEPPPEIFGTTTEVHLNLITCDGTWDPNAKSYSRRLVIFAAGATTTTEKP